MSKKFILIALFAFIATISNAQEVSLTDSLKKIPNVKQGVAYSIQDGKFNHISTVDIIKKNGFNLEAGAAYKADNTGVKAVAVLSYDLLKVKDVVQLPILDLIEFRPGVYVGYGRVEGFQDSQLKGEGDYGISLSVINLKF
jgi:hypothetical protein